MFFTEVISMFARFQARGAFVAAVKFDFAFKVKRGEKGGKRGERGKGEKGETFSPYITIVSSSLVRPIVI